MANPQKENGYTSLSNELLEAIYRSNFTARQLKVLLLVLRYTYGYNRKTAQLSNSFISNGTGIHEVHISKIIKELINLNVIIEKSKPTSTTPRILQINKNYDKWGVTFLVGATKSVGVTNLAKEGLPSRLSEGLPSRLTNKENIIKKTYKENLSCSSDDEACVFFEKIWKLYPLKKGKAQVKISHKRELLKIGYDVIVKAITEYDKGVKDKQYLMYGGRFFTTGYLDYIDTEREAKENDRETTDDYFANY